LDHDVCPHQTTTLDHSRYEKLAPIPINEQHEHMHPTKPTLPKVHPCLLLPTRKKKRKNGKKTELQDKMDIAKHDDQPHEL
jgi:hypothetical protein